MTIWLRRSLRAWLYVNGPLGTILLLAQTVGLPAPGFYLLAWLLMFGLMPGTEIVDVATHSYDFGAKPDWYYALAWPLLVVLTNLAAYVVVGVVIGVLSRYVDRCLWWYDDRRSPVIRARILE